MNVLDALVGEYGPDVFIDDIDEGQSGAVAFIVDETPWTANYEVTDDGVTITNAAQASSDDSEAAADDGEVEASAAPVEVTTAMDADWVARVELLESGLTEANDRIRVLDSLLAQREMAEISAEQLVLD